MDVIALYPHIVILNEAVLQSVQPKWCEMIISGRKTVELRKTRPKCETPFKVYIYCTKSKEHFVHGGIVESLDDLYRMPNGTIKHGYSGELICCDEPYTKNNFLNGKVIGEYICDSIEDYSKWEFDLPSLYRHIKLHSCVDYDMLYEYFPTKKGYGWHISNLVIYDKPKELKEFKRPCIKNNNCISCSRYDYMSGNCHNEIQKPPQSWCYVEKRR